MLSRNCLSLRTLIVGCLFAASILSPWTSFAETFNNPIFSTGADPWIIHRDGFYHYMHTTGQSVKIRKAAKLTGTGGIGSANEVTVFTPPAPNNKAVWAPELHFLRGKWYVYYAADDGNNANHRMYVAEAALPDSQGTYTFKGQITDPSNRWAIDGTVLEQGDGSLYFIWSGWPGAVDGQQNIYIAPMSDPWTISGPRVMIATPTYSWEGWLLEGPQVIKRNGKVFIIYSANASWTDEYAFGMLTNTDGNVLNPASWSKHSQPVFKKYSDANGGVFGPGHGSFTKSLDQTEDWLFYHAAKYSGAGWDRNVRMQKFTWNPDDSPNFGNPIPTSVPITVPSGEGSPSVGGYTLTTVTNGGGGITRNPEQSSYSAGSFVTLTASPNQGQFFAGWSGDAGGYSNPIAVEMDRNKTVTANFTNEIVMDNPEAIFSGTWTTASSATDKFGSDYQYATSAATVTRTATYTPNVTSAGRYDVYVWYPQGSNRSAAAPFTISSEDGSITVTVNQQAGGGGWRLIASGKKFAVGTSGFIRLANNTGETSKLVMADGVRLVYSATQDIPPTITSHPEAKTVIAGQTAVFSVLANGGAPMTYQWRKDGNSLPGKTTSSLTISSAQPSDEGDYSVLVQNAFGSAASSSAHLTVNVPPTITKQPQSQTVNRTESATFSVTVAGTAPFGYQWRFNGGNISGANQANYTIASAEATDAGNYSVVVSNGAGSITSSNASLTVNVVPGGTSPSITRQPESQQIVQGSAATFSVEAAGASPRNFQWRLNGTNIVGATGNALTLNTVQPADAGNYSVVVNNPFGSATSSNAVLTVLIPPTITQHPLAQVVIRGATVQFETAASGTQPLYFQWNFDGNAIPGKSTTALLLQNVQSSHAGFYTMTVSNVAGVVTSSNALLTVNLPPEITVPPESQNVNLGRPATFFVEASGTQPFAYQWRFNGGDIAGATQSSLNFEQVLAEHAGNYAVAISNVAGTVVSADAALTVNFPPTLVTQPLSRTNASGSAVQFSVSATGTEPFHFQWQKNNVNLEDGENISGATSATLSINDLVLLNSGNYSVIVTNIAGVTVSDTALLDVLDAPAILSEPEDAHVDAGMLAQFSISASGSEPLVYQWFFNDAEIAGATATVYSISNVQTENVGQYSVRITNAVGAITSAPASLTVNTDLILPVVKISSPGNNFKTTNSSLVLLGTATDDRGIREVVYSLNNGPSRAASGTNNWSATLELSPGTNTIVVHAIDLAGNASPALYRTFIYSTFSPLTLYVNGSGQVNGVSHGQVLEVGQTYKAKAFVGSGTNFVFTNWTDSSGSVIASTETLYFLMGSNFVLNANFIPNPFLPVSGVYNGLFFETNRLSHHSSGFISLRVTQKMSFSGKLLFDGDSISVSGKFTLDGRANRTVARVKFGKPDVTIELVLNFANYNDSIEGTVGSSDWIAPFFVNRTVWSTNNLANSFTNTYTILIPGIPNSEPNPSGYGYSAMKINSHGKLSVAGRVADGVAFRQGTIISKDGDWPLYSPLYPAPSVVTNGLVIKTNKEYQGSLLGWISLANGAPEGSVTWIKTGWTNAIYTDGFTNQTAIAGSIYTPPNRGDRLWTATDGKFILYNGNLSAPITNSFTLQTNNTVTFTSNNLSDLKLSISSKSGLWSGSFLHPDLQQTTKSYGALLQSPETGGGFFLGTNESGGIIIESE